MDFEVIYYLKTTKVIQAKDLTAACEQAKKFVKNKNYLVVSVIPIIKDTE